MRENFPVYYTGQSLDGSPGRSLRIHYCLSVAQKCYNSRHYLFLLQFGSSKQENLILKLWPAKALTLSMKLIIQSYKQPKCGSRGNHTDNLGNISMSFPVSNYFSWPTAVFSSIKNPRNPVPSCPSLTLMASSSTDLLLLPASDIYCDT